MIYFHLNCWKVIISLFFSNPFSYSNIFGSLCHGQSKLRIINFLSYSDLPLFHLIIQYLNFKIPWDYLQVIRKYFITDLENHCDISLHIIEGTPCYSVHLVTCLLSLSFFSTSNQILMNILDWQKKTGLSSYI